MALLDGDIAALFGSVFGVLYGDGLLHNGQSGPVYDNEGNITGYGGDDDVPIKVQRDAANWAMRQQDGYSEGDCALIILKEPGDIVITTANEVTDTTGARWKIESANLDAAGSHWLCRGRAA
jgi:hypothetical protein